MKIGKPITPSSQHTLVEVVPPSFEGRKIHSNPNAPNYLLERIRYICILALHAFVWLITLPFKLICNKIFSKSSSPVAYYQFTQQINEACHLLSIINLQKLAYVKATAKNGEYDFSCLPYLSRREALGENIEMEMNWNTCAHLMNDPEVAKRYPALKQWVEQGIQAGPTFPNIFDKNGKCLYHRRDGVLRYMTTPYFFIDTQAVENAKMNIGCYGIELNRVFDISEGSLCVKLPIIQDKDGYFAYCFHKKRYCTIEELGITINEDGIVILPKEYSLSAYIPEGVVIKMTPFKGLGAHQVAIAENFGTGFQFEGRNFAVFEISLYKMLLMSLGLDSNNEEATNSSSPEFPVIQDMKRLMQTTTNPWTEGMLDKEHFIQYQIANVLKESPEFYEAAKQLVDQIDFSMWGGFEECMKGAYYNENKQRIAVGEKVNLQNYMPGNEQMMAYFIMRIVRYLSYAACNRNAYEKEMSFDTLFGRLKNILPINVLIESLLLKAKLHHKITVGGEKKILSFMDFWKQLRSILIEKMDGEENCDFVSFDDHGWVVSFDPKLIQKQKKSSHFDNPKFIDELGIAIIESNLSSDLGLFYKGFERV